MPDWIELTAKDGHKLAAYRAKPEGTARGGVVLLQEIFGVNSHIRGLVDGFAGEGYDTIAPALYDRIEPGIELGYTDDDVTRGRALRSAVAVDDVMLDVAAAKLAIAESGKIGAVGYCWGGTLAWLACNTARCRLRHRLLRIHDHRLCRRNADMSRRDDAGRDRYHVSAGEHRGGSRQTPRRRRLHLSGRPRLCLRSAGLLARTVRTTGRPTHTGCLSEILGMKTQLRR